MYSRSTEQNKEFRYRTTQMETTNLWQKGKDNLEKRFAVFSTNNSGATRHFHAKKVNWDTNFIPLANFNWNWFIDTKLRH